MSSTQRNGFFGALIALAGARLARASDFSESDSGHDAANRAARFRENASRCLSAIAAAETPVTLLAMPGADSIV